MRSASAMIEYDVASSGQVLIITDGVLRHLQKYRQVRWFHREAGGQLFARFDGQRIVLEEATGPRRADRRTLYSFRPSRSAEQREIDQRHVAGLHYVGDWHTHPQDIPVPSSMDIESIGDCVRRSHHELNGFIMIIVGRLNPPQGLHVSLHDGKDSHVLAPLGLDIVECEDGNTGSANESKPTRRRQ